MSSINADSATEHDAIKLISLEEFTVVNSGYNVIPPTADPETPNERTAFSSASVGNVAVNLDRPTASVAPNEDENS